MNYYYQARHSWTFEKGFDRTQSDGDFVDDFCRKFFVQQKSLKRGPPPIGGTIFIILIVYYSSYLFINIVLSEVLYYSLFECNNDNLFLFCLTTSDIFFALRFNV